MRFAFCLFKYFPYGGLQSDFLNIALAAVKRGHQVDVLTRSWEGTLPSECTVELIEARSWTNIGRDERFIENSLSFLKDHNYYDAIIGFNKMPGLDVYFAADPCYAHKMFSKSRWSRLARRHRYRESWEREIFAPEKKTRILILSEQEKEHFQEHYQTPDERFFFLPPGLNQAKLQGCRSPLVRGKIRKEFGLKEDDFFILMVGSGFRVKGVDRSLEAFASLPEEFQKKTRMIVVGDDRPRSFLRMAKSMGIEKQITFAGGRDNVADFYQAADLLLHPAYRESAGKVLLESTVMGLPVITTDTCGYASYITQAKAGIVLASPFSQKELNQVLRESLSSSQQLEKWREGGKSFGQEQDLYSLAEKAVTYIEEAVLKS